MKICFGTFVKVLLLCGVDKIEKKKLLNTIVQSVDLNCILSSNAVTNLLQCESNLPNTRKNALGDVISKAENADPQKVAEYFADKLVDQFLKPGEQKKAILAIRELIIQDGSIGENTVVEIVSKRTKKALLVQSEFVLHQFLAGVFLFVVPRDNRLGKAISEEINQDFMESFMMLQDSITIYQNAQKSIYDLTLEVFIDYLANAKDKYKNIKTLLYKNEPKPFNDLYIPNCIERTGDINMKENLGEASIDKLISISNFLILEGDSGIGKSMMMQYLFLSAIDEVSNSHRIPFLLNLRDFNNSEETVENFIFSRINVLNRSITKKDFNAVLTKGQALLILDGLDEINHNNRENFRSKLEDFIDTYFDNCFIISSRPVSSFISFNRFISIKILPFTDEQVIQLIRKFDADSEIKSQFIEKLNSHVYFRDGIFNTHQEFVENPLLLTLMFMIFADTGEIHFKMHEFYREVFEVLVKKHDDSKCLLREQRTGLSKRKFIEYFSKFCYLTHISEESTFTEDSFIKHFKKVKADGVEPDEFLYDISHNLYILPFNGKTYQFIHRSFHEYFCAVYIIGLDDESIIELVDFFDEYRNSDILNMMYDMDSKIVESLIFKPFLENIFITYDDSDYSYQTFLEQIYYEFSYSLEKSFSLEDCDSCSCIYDLFKMKNLEETYEYSFNNIPHYPDLMKDSFISAIDKNGRKHTIPSDYKLKRISDEFSSFNTLEIVFGDGNSKSEYDTIVYNNTIKEYGCDYFVSFKDLFDNKDKYQKLFDAVNDDRFELKVEYNAVKNFLEDFKN